MLYLFVGLFVCAKLNKYSIPSNKNSIFFEKVKQFSVINESFSVENGLMSATQKVKRNKVFEKYESVIGDMYKK